MIKVVAHINVKSDSIEKVVPLFKELIETTKKHDLGCMVYELFADVDEPTHFTFIETWLDENALNAHGKSEHFTRLMGAASVFFTKEPIIIKMKQFL